MLHSKSRSRRSWSWLISRLNWCGLRTVHRPKARAAAGATSVQHSSGDPNRAIDFARTRAAAARPCASCRLTDRSMSRAVLRSGRVVMSHILSVLGGWALTPRNVQGQCGDQ